MGIETNSSRSCGEKPVRKGFWENVDSLKSGGDWQSGSEYDDKLDVWQTCKIEDLEDKMQVLTWAAFKNMKQDILDFMDDGESTTREKKRMYAGAAFINDIVMKSYNEIKEKGDFMPITSFLMGFIQELEKQSNGDPKKGIQPDKSALEILSYLVGIKEEDNPAVFNAMKNSLDPMAIRALSAIYESIEGTDESYEQAKEYLKSAEFVTFINNAENVIEKSGNLDKLTGEQLNWLLFELYDDITVYAATKYPENYTKYKDKKGFVLYRAKDVDKHFEDTSTLFKHMAKVLLHGGKVGKSVEGDIGFNQDKGKIKRVLKLLVDVYADMDKKKGSSGIRYPNMHSFLNKNKNITAKHGTWKGILSLGYHGIDVEQNPKTAHRKLIQLQNELSPAEKTNNGI